MTTTLVTGGNGFIGRYTVEELLRRGRSVVVLDRVQHPTLPGVELHWGDIRDATSVTEAMAHADSWIHLAGVLGTQETIKNPSPAAETNILGGLNVFRAAAQYGLPGVNIAVGNHWETNTYSITKSTMERFAKMFRAYDNLPVTTVRALNAYGPRQSVAAPYGTSKVRKIMPSFVMRALHGDPIEIYGDGLQVMDMIFVADVARVLVDALELTEREGGQEQVFEAGSGRDTTVLDIANAVVHCVGQGEIRHVPMRPGETPGAVVLADTGTLAPLGIKPDDLIALEQGVPTTVEYFRNTL
jgi:UDP-glucose 4-epimerase